MTRISFAAALALASALLTPNTLPAHAVTEQVLYSFKSPAYGYPFGRLLLRGSSLFGTGYGDGVTGAGQVFKLTNSGGVWKETAPLKFDGFDDGGGPAAGLISDSLGTLYGTTYYGDANVEGNVFSLYRSGRAWLHGTIWAFPSTADDGQNPACDLVVDSAGDLYGTTVYGGASGAGTVFELSAPYWTEARLHDFTGGSDGGYPSAGLLRDSSGNLYGTTGAGGGSGCGGNGCGTVFELTSSGGGWNFSTLYTFSGSDGEGPVGVLVLDKKGALYGTTSYGGTGGSGTAFRLYQSGGVWTLKTLYPFTGGSDGGRPVAALHWNGSGGLYGTASNGGNPGCVDGNGCGTVFELTQSGGVWSETVLYSFAASGGDAQNPLGAVMLDKVGNLYGTTQYGGADGYGAVYEITP